MKTLLQINPVIRVNTSTGRIMQEIGSLVMRHGWKSYIAYSKGRDGKRTCQSEPVPVGTVADVAWHGIMTRLFDRHGLASQRATRRFIKRIEEIKPDIVHIHNIHGYFLNYPLLFEYLSKRNIPVVWTVHDCWLYTGHCYYYSFEGCQRWQTGCGACPQRRKFPASWWVDRSHKNFLDKKAAFTSLAKNQLTIVPVSEWISGEMQRSFFKGYNFRVIHNGIDTDVFAPSDTEPVKAKYGLTGRRVILGVASIWSQEKGWDDFLKLSTRLQADECIVLVGVSQELQKQLPKNIVGISRTENIHQLAELYSAAEVFVNPTWQDNFPTVNLESIACGTPVITYRTGGSIEAVTEKTGFVVEQGDIEGIINAVRVVERNGKNHYRVPCREYALANFRKDERYADYLKLYDELLEQDAASNG